MQTEGTFAQESNDASICLDQIQQQSVNENSGVNESGQNVVQNEAMDIEENHQDEENSCEKKQNNSKGKNTQTKKKPTADTSLIIEGKRQRKPITVVEREPSPKKRVIKKEPQKYQKSEQIVEICGRILEWQQKQSDLKLLGLPTIIIDKQKINEFLKDYQIKDEAGKECCIKTLIRLIGESVYCKEKSMVKSCIQNQIQQIYNENNLQFNWSDQQWDEWIKSFIKVKYEDVNNKEVQDQFFNFKHLYTLTGNRFPNYIEDSQVHVTLVVVQANQIDDLKKICDMNELKNIRLVRDYLINLNKKLDNLKNLCQKIEALKKQEDEQAILTAYEKIEQEILDAKNSNVQFLKQTEIKQKSQQKPKSKPQNLEKIEQSLEAKSNEQPKVEQTQEQQDATEKKIAENKAAKKQEKNKQKLDQLANIKKLDQFKFKKAEIINPPPKDEVNQPNDQTPKKAEQPEQTEQNQQGDQQIIPQTESKKDLNATPINKNQITRFFQPVKQQEIQKQDVYISKKLSEYRQEQFEQLLENYQSVEKPEVSLADYNTDEIEITEFKQQQVRVRKVYIFIEDSMKEYNGHRFLQINQRIRPRAPFTKDDQVNYDEDSEDEVEELNAQSLSHSNNTEEEISEEEEQNNSFLVDDDHLSQDEVDDPEELVNNKLINDNAQNQNGLLFIKTEAQDLEPYKAIYIPQYFTVLQQKETLNSTQTSQNNTLVNYSKPQTLIPKGKMAFKNTQKKQKPKKPRAQAQQNQQLLQGQQQLQLVNQTVQQTIQNNLVNRQQEAIAMEENQQISEQTPVKEKETQEKEAQSSENNIVQEGLH